MPVPRRRRYQIRLRKAVAGTCLAAATAASITGFTAVPALAASSRTVAATSDYEADDIILGFGPVSPASVSAPVSVATLAPSATERLAGVRADLDTAVLMRLVTPEQAAGFYSQIERRVAAGL
jgi:hypothetical protein